MMIYNNEVPDKDYLLQADYSMFKYSQYSYN